MYCYFILLIIQQVLDAPELQDDFYLNLVDWSSQNVLSVGLGSCVYLWSACTSQVTRLCDLSSDNNSVTSVAWSERVSVTNITKNKVLQYLLLKQKRYNKWHCVYVCRQRVRTQKRLNHLKIEKRWQTADIIVANFHGISWILFTKTKANAQLT